MNDNFRLDKWLWAARFFKTRTLAQDAVTGGKVKVNGNRAKPGREVHVGDRLVIHREPFTFEVQILAVSMQRGPASIAATLYVESEESIHNRAVAEETLRQDRLSRPMVVAGLGRPTKRDRRRLDRWGGEE